MGVCVWGDGSQQSLISVMGLFLAEGVCNEFQAKWSALKTELLIWTAAVAGQSSSQG